MVAILVWQFKNFKITKILFNHDHIGIIIIIQMILTYQLSQSSAKVAVEYPRIISRGCFDKPHLKQTNYSIKAELASILMACSSSSLLFCNYCNFQCSSNAVLLKHQRATHENEPDFRISCNFWGLCYKKWNTLKKHLQRCHKGNWIIDT